MTFNVQKLDFKRTLAPQTGPQAPFENVQASISMQSYTMNRYALGITASAESLKTDEGKAVLEGGLVNIAVAFADTMEQAGFMELISRRHYYRIQARLNGVRSAPGEDPFAEEKAMFDCVRKGSRGYFIMLDKVRSYMKSIIPTDIIVPEGIRSLVAGDPAESEYYRAGPDARRNAIMGADAQMPNIEGGLRTHVARGFTLDDGAVVMDPLGHDVTIGDHFRLEDYTTCVPAAEYDRCHRRIYVFDMSITNGGDFGAVELMYALRHSERFVNDAVGSLSPVHADLADNVGRRASPPRHRRARPRPVRRPVPAPPRRRLVPRLPGHWPAGARRPGRTRTFAPWPIRCCHHGACSGLSRRRRCRARAASRSISLIPNARVHRRRARGHETRRGQDGRRRHAYDRRHERRGLLGRPLACAPLPTRPAPTGPFSTRPGPFPGPWSGYGPRRARCSSRRTRPLTRPLCPPDSRPWPATRLTA